MNLFARRANSFRTAIFSLIILWGVAYLMGWMERFDDPLDLFFALPLTLMFAWFVLPQNLLYNLFGLTYQSTPMWLQWASFLGYWMLVLSLQIAFLSLRRWVLLVILSLIVLTSAQGCMVFVDEYGGDIG